MQRENQFVTNQASNHFFFQVCCAVLVYHTFSVCVSASLPLPCAPTLRTGGVAIPCLASPKCVGCTTLRWCSSCIHWQDWCKPFLSEFHLIIMTNAMWDSYLTRSDVPEMVWMWPQYGKQGSDGTVPRLYPNWWLWRWACLTQCCGWPSSAGPSTWLTGHQTHVAGKLHLSLYKVTQLPLPSVNCLVMPHTYLRGMYLLDNIPLQVLLVTGFSSKLRGSEQHSAVHHTCAVSEQCI